MTSKPDSRPDAINPQALKAARKRRGMSQLELAKATGCTKDTVSRWERGISRRVRTHLRKPLCNALRIKWGKLTRPTDQSQDLAGDVTTKVSIAKDAWISLLIVALRYNVRTRDVLDLAPLLFLIVAERSLLERKRRLQKIDATWQEAEGKLLENCAHLGGIITARSLSADNQLHEEKESLSKRDVFGRTIIYENWNEGDEGPFVHFVRDLAKNLPQDAVVSIDSFDGDMIGGYRIADDTLRACTGISKAEESSKKLLHFIHYGVIDFVECVRVRSEGDDENYRQWLSEELARAEKESQHQLEEFMDDFGPRPVAAGESDASENRSER